VGLALLLIPEGLGIESTGRGCDAGEDRQSKQRCEERAPHRLVKPKPIHAKRAQKTSWDNPVMLAKLANAYVRAGGDDEKVASSG